MVSLLEATQVTKCDEACRACVCDRDGQIRSQGKNQACDHILSSKYNKCIWRGCRVLVCVSDGQNLYNSKSSSSDYIFLSP
jgi:hypothetical protein